MSSRAEEIRSASPAERSRLTGSSPGLKPLPSPRPAKIDPVKEKEKAQGISIIENLIAVMMEKRHNDLPEILQQLKELPSGINLQPPSSGQTALHCAVKCALLPVIKVLYTIPGLDLNAPDQINWDSPLHVACSSELSDIIAYLLYVGADPNQKNKQGISAYQEAKGSSALVLKTYFQEGRAGLLRGWPFLSSLKVNLAAISARDEFECLLRRSDEFQNRIKIPTTANTMRVLGIDASRRTSIVQMASGCRIVVHKKLQSLISDFLSTKLRSGTTKEKQLYNGMSVDDFVRRLIIKRPLKFFTHMDTTMLRDRSDPEPSDWLNSRLLT